MRILLCSISSTHEITGIGKYNGELFDWFRGRGHQVDVLTTIPYYPYWEIYDEYKGERFKVESVENGSIRSFLLPVSKNVTTKRRVLMDSVFGLKTLFHLPYLSIKNQYDVILLVLPPITAFPAAIIGKLLGKTKLHIHIQDLQLEAAKELNLLPNTIVSLLGSYERFSLKSADLVTTISQNMLETVKNKLKGKGTPTALFKNWADTETIRPVKNKNWLKKKFGYKKDDFLIVYSGNIGKKQGVEQILYVAVELKNYDNIQFLILGDGAGKPELLQRARQLEITNVTFGDLVAEEDLNLMLNGSDVQVVLQRKSVSDSFLPSKYVNILSAGIPSVVTATEGTELYGMISNNNLSMLAEPENTCDLSKAIMQLYQDKELRKTLSENSRTYAIENFSRQIILEQIETIYKSY